MTHKPTLMPRAVWFFAESQSCANLLFDRVPFLCQRSSFAIGNKTRPRLGWFARITIMLKVRKSRIDLSRLTDEQLCDVGLTRDEVAAEIARPVWDVPIWSRR